MIHDELKNIGECMCPFCDYEIQKPERIDIPCCENQRMLNDNNKNVCLNCGSVYGYDYVSDYINFHENKYTIRQKSVYHRKYHIENILSNYHLSVINRNKIMLIFKEIGQVLPLVNKGRKRMINLKYVLKQLFLMLDLDIDIKIKSKRTLKFYNNYWVEILLLIGDKIQSIINK